MPSTSTSTGCPSLEELDLAGLLGVAGQHPLAEIGKRGAVLRGHELPEPFLHRGLAVQAQQCGPGEIDFQDPPLVVPDKIPNRGEIEEFEVLLGCLLGRRLGPLQFLVLHFQFDLMDLQLVEQGANVCLGRRQFAFGPAGLQPLLRLAAQFARRRQARIDSVLLRHGFTLACLPWARNSPSQRRQGNATNSVIVSIS